MKKVFSMLLMLCLMLQLPNTVIVASEMQLNDQEFYSCCNLDNELYCFGNEDDEWYRSVDEDNNEWYYNAFDEMMYNHWRDTFFGKATVFVGSDTLIIDDQSIELESAVEIINGEVAVPFDVLEELGVQVEAHSNGVSASKCDRSVEVDFDEISVRGNDNTTTPASIFIEDRLIERRQPPLSEDRLIFDSSRPLLPVSLLGEQGLGFEVDYNALTGEITITSDYQTKRIVAKVRPGASAPNITSAQTLAAPNDIYIFQFDTKDEARAAHIALNNDPNIVFAEPDRLATNTKHDIEMVQEVPMTTASNAIHLSWGPSAMNAATFANHLIANNRHNREVIVAVIDTGVDTGLSFFSGRHVPGRNLHPNNNDTSDYHIHGHGTAVAAVLIDAARIVPGIKIMPVRNDTNTGQTTYLYVANSITWAADNGARVILINRGFACSVQQPNNIIHNAINHVVTNRRATVIAGAEFNSNVDAGTLCASHMSNVISVVAFDINNRPWLNSNHGSAIDIAAPGVGINVLNRDGTVTRSISGTSLASPHVAAAAAMLIADNLDRTPAQIRNIIRDYRAWFTDPSFFGRYGTGILDIGVAAAHLPARSLVVSPTSRNISPSAQSFIVNITSNVTWTAHSNNSWLEIDLPRNGSNNGTLTIRTTENTMPGERAGSITVSGGGITRHINVRQARIPVVQTNVADQITRTSARLRGTLVWAPGANIPADFGFEISMHANMSNSQELEFNHNFHPRDFDVALANLTPNTMYYFRVFTRRHGYMGPRVNGVTRSFRTAP